MEIKCLIVGELTISGNRTNLERFLTEACHGTLSEDDDRFLFTGHLSIAGTDNAYVYDRESSLFYYPNDIKAQDGYQFVNITYAQSPNIKDKDLEKLSKEYSLDFRLYVYICCLQISRYISVHNGKTLCDDYTKGRGAYKNPIMQSAPVNITNPGERQ